MPEKPPPPTTCPLSLETLMLTVGQVARMLNCSTRTVYRMADKGSIPPPVRFGSLVRWNRKAIDAWVADGCPT